MTICKLNIYKQNKQEMFLGKTNHKKKESVFFYQNYFAAFKLE